MAKKSVKKPKAAKSYLVVRYEPTAKDGSKFLEKDNTSGTAALYRAFSTAKKPLTLIEAYESLKGKMESNAAWERLSKYAISSSLHKNGFLKKIERREEANGANGSPKPKRQRKPRAAKQEPPTTATERQEQAATA